MFEKSRIFVLYYRMAVTHVCRQDGGLPQVAPPQLKCHHKIWTRGSGTVGGARSQQKKVCGREASTPHLLIPCRPTSISIPVSENTLYVFINVFIYRPTWFISGGKYNYLYILKLDNVVSLWNMLVVLNDWCHECHVIWISIIAEVNEDIGDFFNIKWHLNIELD